MRKILALIALLPALAVGQSAQMNLAYLAHQLHSGGIVPLSALQTIASDSVLCNSGSSSAFPSVCTSPVLLGLTVNSGATTLNGGATVASGLTVSSGNFAVNSGTTTLGGATTVQSGGLTVSAGASSFGGTVSGTGNWSNTALSGVLSTSASNVDITGGNSGQIAQINSSAGTDDKIYASVVDSGGAYRARLVNDANNAATDWLTVSRSGTAVGAVNFPNGTFEVGGHPVEVYATVVGTSSSCSISSSYASQGVTSCTRNATGNYTITTSVTAPSPFVCTGIGNGYPFFLYEGGSTTTSIVSIGLTNIGGSAVDGTFELICKG